jgi:hypothetical protein
MKSWGWKILIIMLLWPTNAFCQNAVECTVQQNLEHLYSIELTDSENIDRIITYIILNESANNLRVARNYITERNDDYSPLLMSLYLNSVMKKEDLNDEEILDHLTQYKNMEKDNPFPYYFLSCYYAQKENYGLSLKYLSEGNTKLACKRYLVQKADTIIKYLNDQKENELTAYSSQIQLYATDSYQVFRRLSQMLLKSNVKGAASEEIFKMGVKLENCSYTLLDKIFSNAIQCDAVKHSVDINKELYDQLLEKRKAITQLQEKINEVIQKNELINYLRAMKEIGELAAIKKMLDPNSP